jgi:hypothetical protein
MIDYLDDHFWARLGAWLVGLVGLLFYAPAVIKYIDWATNTNPGDTYLNLVVAFFLGLLAIIATVLGFMWIAVQCVSLDYVFGVDQ